MKKKKLVASLLAVTLAASTVLAGCGDNSNDSSSPSGSNPSGSAPSASTPSTGGDGNDTPSEPAELLPYAAGTVIRMACGYSNSSTGMRFNADILKDATSITLADGKTYNSGDFKPTWQAVQEILGITIEDKYQNNNGTNEYKYWDAQMDQIDMLSGTAALLTENGPAKLVNIAEYLDKMPNFKAYLDANPIVRLSITGEAEGPNAGAIYFSPYFDGVNDIEKMPLMRTDWVEKLLNGEGEFTADASNKTAAPVYQPYMPTSGKVEVEVVNPSTLAKDSLTKNYDAYGNIVAKMNEAGSVDGVTAVNMLREYIDKTYDGYYGTNRADLFIGQNAAWDADELVALLRCVVANPQKLNGGNSVQGLFSREDANDQRRADVFRFAGTLFGVRGMESRMDYLYVGNDNKLHDARIEEETYVALSRMHDMALEGLISEAFLKEEDVKTERYLEQDMGFMHYDYNQTQTAYNATALNKDGDEGEKYMAVMIPVARWDDGTGEQFMRFTESWRSVKTDGWGISKLGVGNDENKLNACLALIDYAYSPEGQVMMSYGPDDFIKHDASGNIVYFDFNGEQWPVIADATYEELWDRANGNYTNYARYYIGSTLSFVKSQAFEYQCTHEVGKEGAGYISNAIAAGVIHHPELALASKPWYTSVPTVLPQTVNENNAINDLTNLGTAKFHVSSGLDDDNLFIDIITNGFGTGDAGADPAATAKKVADEWGGTTYLMHRNTAWEKLVKFYNSL